MHYKIIITIVIITIMYKFVVYFKELPKPVKLSTYIYVGSLLIYNCIGTWFDAKNKLIEFRENKLDKEETKIITDEWNAVKYGANSNFGERLFNSIIWPVKIISDTIPFLVLQLNPPKKHTNETDETDDTKNN
jgi:hypothetical protein